MSRSSTIILLGVLTVLIPFSGLPLAFRSLITVVFGMSVLVVGLSLRSREAHVAHVGVEK